jgi:hypothetical protein
MWFAEIWRLWKPALADEVSLVGIIYLLGLVAVLLLIHLTALAVLRRLGSSL